MSNTLVHFRDCGSYEQGHGKSLFEMFMAFSLHCVREDRIFDIHLRLDM
jgi:hypothetical protein